MKRLCAFVLLLAFLALYPTSVAAAQAYEIPELHMRIELPDDWMVFTREIQADDPNLERIGSDRVTLEKMLLEKNIYVNAFKAGTGHEFEDVAVSMRETDDSKEIVDLYTLTDDAIKSMANERIADQNSVHYTHFFIYRTTKVCYIVFDCYQEIENERLYGRQYFTIKNGQEIKITLLSFYKLISQQHEQMLKETVDSIQFEGIVKPVSVSVQTEPPAIVSEKPLPTEPSYTVQPNSTMKPVVEQTEKPETPEPNDDTAPILSEITGNPLLRSIVVLLLAVLMVGSFALIVHFVKMWIKRK